MLSTSEAAIKYEIMKLVLRKIALFKRQRQNDQTPL